MPIVPYFEISHEKPSSGVLEAQVVHAENAHSEADFGLNRIEINIKGFLRDGELGEPHGHHPAFAPDEKSERVFKGDDFECAGIRQAVVRQKSFDGGVDQHFELRQLRMDAVLDGVGILRGELELIGGVEFGLKFDRFDRRTAEAEGIYSDLHPGHPAWTESGGCG